MGNQSNLWKDETLQTHPEAGLQQVVVDSNLKGWCEKGNLLVCGILTYKLTKLVLKFVHRMCI